ncbi:hypothetical protein KVR01_001671 [Diaporthe batatas]|uniref:uncharacterized protein n=1 Tax=Diaporthe batatas TaxID=748121 RepID=UPI001D043727|nr:uncharacterized protein KVR01_001671 [Diaporthe batatas]KAG8168922.1 hypothetical protein KVR01_001671 [Diaporthe batatas]
MVLHAGGIAMSNTNTEILLAGAAAAFAVDLVVYPLDTVKTRLQSQDYLKTFSRSASASHASAGHASGSVFRGLYQGVGSVVIATLPAAGLFFTTYEATKPFYAGLSSALPGHAALPTPLVHSLASGTAEMASCLVLTPAEVIKQNAQMIRSSRGSGPEPSRGWRNSTSIQAFRDLAAPGDAGGPARRLLTGYTALVARNLPFTALQFPIFEALRRRIWESRDRQAKATHTPKDRQDGDGAARGERRVEQGAVARGLLETGLVNGASAALSGAVAAVVTSPADTVKTRMMLFAGQERQQRALLEKQGQELRERRKQLEGAARRQGLNGMQVARLIYQEKGVHGLFRGGLLRASWTALGSGLYLGTYEVAKVWLKGSSGAGDRDDDNL